MTVRSRGLVAQGFGFALATIAFATFGVSGQASAASPKQPVAVGSQVAVPSANIFDTTVKSSRSARRAIIDIDPIDPNVLHRWPHLADTTAPELTH